MKNENTQIQVDEKQSRFEQLKQLKEQNPEMPNIQLIEQLNINISYFYRLLSQLNKSRQQV